MNQTTEELLAERQSTHGEYFDHARCTQALLRVLQQEKNYGKLSDMQKETCHMIAHKLGRVVTGNPDVADHWDDIAGYARLISQRLEKQPPIYDKRKDMWGTLAEQWNCTPEQARQIAAGIVRSENDHTKRSHEAMRPGTPEDGGHHAAAAIDEDKLEKELGEAVAAELGSGS